MAPTASPTSITSNDNDMEFTQFVVASRDKALLYGDYSTYRTQLAHRLLNCRKKLSVSTRHRGKYNHNANAIKAEQVAEDVNYAWLQVLTAERAFAQAMAMKAAHAANKTGITGHARSHIVSRLDKAAKYAEHLAGVLQDPASGATDVDRLEARAYAALLRGAFAFEKQAWQLCLANYAAVWAIYSALSSSSSSSSSSTTSSATRADTLRDLLTDTLEPSLRYAAYQLKMPRSKPIPMIAREALEAAAAAAAAAAQDHDDDDDMAVAVVIAATPDTAALVAAINALDATVLQPKTAAAAAAEGDDSVVASTRTLTWRSRAVTIEDAAIASAWAALDLAKARLAAHLSTSTTTTTTTTSSARRTAKDKAAAYDDVLTVSQDVVDATKAAIDDLRSEGIPQSDPSVQVLYIARTAATYEMISDRIGRNRVLTGPHDGALAHLDGVPRANANANKVRCKDETPGRFLARLKEKVVLYDGILQSLDTVKELPGVAADAGLAAQLEATAQYFVALKALALARSYTVAGQAVNALALVKHGYEQCSAAVPVLETANTDDDDDNNKDSPLQTINVSGDDARFLLDLLQAELQRARALVDIEKQLPAKPTTTTTTTTTTTKTTKTAGTLALSETLGDYPAGGVDLDNIVTYPPRIEAMPIKPIFLDIAWNYIDYPKKAGAGAAAAAAAAAAAPAVADSPAEEPPKRGWFGFKR